MEALADCACLPYSQRVCAAAGQVLRINGMASSRLSPPTPLEELELEWSELSQSLDLANPSVLGSIQGQPSLVILPGVLKPGLTYTFQLRATYVHRPALPRSSHRCADHPPSASPALSPHRLWRPAPSWSPLRLLAAL